MPPTKQGRWFVKSVHAGSNPLHTPMQPQRKGALHGIGISAVCINILIYLQMHT